MTHVEANLMRESNTADMGAGCQSRARQLALAPTVRTKDIALEMGAKLCDPNVGYEIQRRLLEEWDPARRGRCRAMLMQVLPFKVEKDRRQAPRETFMTRPPRYYGRNLSSRDTESGCR